MARFQSYRRHASGVISGLHVTVFATLAGAFALIGVRRSPH